MQVSTKVRMLIIALLGGIPAMAQSTAGDYSAGTTALSTVAEEIVKYVPDYKNTYRGDRADEKEQNEISYN